MTVDARHRADERECRPMFGPLYHSHAVNKSCARVSGDMLRMLILLAGIASILGCDPVRTITHHVTVEVADEQGLPVPNVDVAIKESWESWQTWGGEMNEADKGYYRGQWASDFVPWRKGVTDAEGKAAIVIEITALDRTTGKEPPPKRDVVSNREYLVKARGRNLEEELRLVMKPGASVKGKVYAVSVVDIEKPRYCETRR
jgi:hypothetical protein